MQNPENPRKWRFTWEAQSHSPTLRLFLFDSQTRPSLQCRSLEAHLNLSQSQLLVSWLEEEDGGVQEISLRVPIPRVLVDPESPLSLRALDDYIEAKLVLLLPVDHPLVSSFDSVLDLSQGGDNAVADGVKPLVMDSDLKGLSSMEGGVHFYCRSCSNRLTLTPLRHFMEMPSVEWREVADNWFGACCCSFGGVSEKLVYRYANSYKCMKGVCLINPTTIILCKDDLVECKFYDLTKEFQSEADIPSYNVSKETTLNPRSIPEKVTGSADKSEKEYDLSGIFSLMHLKNDNLAVNSQLTTEERNDHRSFSAFSEDVASAPCCIVHTTDLIHDHSGKSCQGDVCDTNTLDQKATKLLADQELFLNGFLGNAFMARSSNLSRGIKWMEFVCPQCSSLLGAYPFGNGHAPIDGGVRFFKCYISTSPPASGAVDLYRKYTLQRMFTNQLLESAKDELSFRTVVRNLTTKAPMLQIVLLNPNSWCCSGFCLDDGSDIKSVTKSDFLPVIKVLFSDCSNVTESQLKMLEDQAKKNLADEVFMFRHQVNELINSLESAKDMLPPSCYSLQGLFLSSLQR